MRTIIMPMLATINILIAIVLIAILILKTRTVSLVSVPRLGTSKSHASWDKRLSWLHHSTPSGQLVWRDRDDKSVKLSYQPQNVNIYGSDWLSQRWNDAQEECLISREMDKASQGQGANEKLPPTPKNEAYQTPQVEPFDRGRYDSFDDLTSGSSPEDDDGSKVRKLKLYLLLLIGLRIAIVLIVLSSIYYMDYE